MNPQRRTRMHRSLSAGAEREVCSTAETIQPQQTTRKLIDYTVSPCNRRRLTFQQNQSRTFPSNSLPEQIDEDTPTTRTNPQAILAASSPLNLPSFLYLDEKSLYRSSSSSGISEESPKHAERIDFFLKVQKTRRSSDSTINELRAGFGANNKMRSQKSRLFGSFSENGECRSSYTDLKRVLSQGKGLSDLNY